MTSTPVPPKTAAGSVPQHIALYESLPSLIAQVRAGKIALGTTLQLRLIIGKHRKQATAHLLSKGLPDPFINLPAGLNPDIKLPPELEALQLEVSKTPRPAANSASSAGGTPNDQPRPAMANPQARPPQAGQAVTRNPTPGMVRPPVAPGVRPPASGTPMQQAPPRPPVQQAQTPQPAGNRPQPKPKPKAAPQQVRPPVAPPATNAASPAPAPAQPTAKTSAVSTPVPSRPSSEAPSQPGQAGTRPPVMAPGGKYSWAQVFQLSEAERQAWFDEVGLSGRSLSG
ncbi:hypothetical protein HD553DRAFT_156923 [Filobasidium floriforme]|uniref:uncharacterized protein n=1 Tax=Filobasidium floriforme TaxID=5210 RepID=UPI001E8E96BE|nr:uncharacterized protein HD553DRAFT_156923 [Filobasidium floriforme]KAH8089165.1 hypothetical protein HD553DRAFT_156923 [Filobasidium floriforme]